MDALLLCYWLVAAASIPALASMIHRYARHLYASDYEEVNPVASVLTALALALVWPLGYIAVGTLFLISKDERKESERRRREKSIEAAREFLRQQELAAKADFDRMLGPSKPAVLRRAAQFFPAPWRRP